MRLARVDVLVIDDFAISPVSDEERRHLLELLEYRYGTKSTIVTSQLAPADWHDYLANPTLADAICDRIVHHSHRLMLKGPSRRKEKPTAEPERNSERRFTPVTITDPRGHVAPIRAVTLTGMRTIGRIAELLDI